MRVSLIRLTDDSYYMMLTWHHLLFDGWSMPVLMEEFLNIYEQIIKGKEVTVKESDDKYEDYIRYTERVDIQ